MKILAKTGLKLFTIGFSILFGSYAIAGDPAGTILNKGIPAYDLEVVLRDITFGAPKSEEWGQSKVTIPPNTPPGNLPPFYTLTYAGDTIPTGWKTTFK